MMLIAERTNDGATAETAFQQIQTAYETAQTGGQRAMAAVFQAELPNAEAILQRLNGK